MHAGLHVPLHPWYSDGRLAQVLCGVSAVFKEQSLANDVENSNGHCAAVFKKKPVSGHGGPLALLRKAVGNVLLSNGDLCTGITCE